MGTQWAGSAGLPLRPPPLTCSPLPRCRLGALSGILATLTFPLLHRWLGLVGTAGLSIWLQLACLLAGVAPALAAALGGGVSPAAHMYALVWGLVLSRFGLWSFDLCANQLMQETVGHAALGTVSGVQGALQSLFQVGSAAAACPVPCALCLVPCALCSPSGGLHPRPPALPFPPQMLAYLAGVLVPATDRFVYLMAGSCCAVATAAALFTSFALRSCCGRNLGVAPPALQEL